MARKKKFVEKLSTEEQSALEDGYKYGKSADYRQRCHGILLSSQGYDVEQISSILNCSKLAVYQWLGKWEREGISALVRKSGQGRKRKLLLNDPEHVQVVKEAVKEHAQSSAAILAEVKEQLGMEALSKKSLKRFLKNLITDGSDSGDG